MSLLTRTPILSDQVPTLTISFNLNDVLREGISPNTASTQHSVHTTTHREVLTLITGHRFMKYDTAIVKEGVGLHIPTR